jgi:hypothetical protein
MLNSMIHLCALSLGVGSPYALSCRFGMGISEVPR